MAELFVVNGICCGTVFMVPVAPTIVGRTPECHIQLADPWISSAHARFESRDGAMWLVDLGSRNGTFVNDVQIAESVLEDGAVIRFGRTEADFRNKSAETTNPSYDPNREGTVVRYVEDLKSRPGLSRTGTGALYAANQLERMLSLQQEIGHALIGSATSDATLHGLLSAVAMATRAERSSLLLMDPAGEMTARVSVPAAAPPTPVKSRVRSAMSNRAGLISAEGQRDGQGAATFADSGEPRSVMHVPIWADNRILGMFVLERRPTDPFVSEDLEIVTSAGYQAALAIERSRLFKQARDSEEERKKLLSHISKDVAAVILAKREDNAENLASVRDDVTVLFSDIKGFTAMTERLPPLELATLLQAYFNSMTQAIAVEGGTLDKFIGDGLMATFGAPVAQRNAAIHALRCALDMRDRLAVLNAGLAMDRQIVIRVGINTGRVIAGSFGSLEKMEFTVLGDTVNTASRLESIAEPGKIYVGKTTVEKCKASFEFMQLGTRQVKGKNNLVEVFELIGPKPS